MVPQKEWFDFQENICDYFKSIGFEAETNKTVKGVRTNHDIDVYVHTKFMGQNLTWIIEAKKWKSKVNKLQVLGLRTIADDIGVDGGFIISEKGFQSGAIEASINTNIRLMTFEQLKIITKDFVEDDILKHYEERIILINRRYWSHSKVVRKDYGLRLELGDNTYSVPFIIHITEEAIRSARNKEYPIILETTLKEQYGEQKAENFQQLVNWMNINFNVIDRKVLDAEKEMQINGRFNPKFR